VSHCPLIRAYADGSVGQMISSYTPAIVIGFVLMMTGIVDRKTAHGAPTPA
jgi:hypothetical protein